MQVCEKHTQANAIDFVDDVIDKLPFRIREIRADNGHEFQAKFHWHVEDLGIRHAYIKRGTPQLNGKVERSRRSDGKNFTSCSVTQVMSISKPNWTNGSAFTTSTDRTARTMERHLTKPSEKSYNQQKGRLTSNRTLPNTSSGMPQALA